MGTVNKVYGINGEGEVMFVRLMRYSYIVQEGIPTPPTKCLLTI